MTVFNQAISTAQQIRRYLALTQLLAQPDPADLPKRGRRYVCAGDGTRRERLKLELERAYLRHRKADHGEQADIGAVRRAKLRLAS